MPYKKRSYYKHEEAKARDYSLFVIACEGTKTEPSYFAPFDNFERIKVRILEHKQTESAPSHVLAAAKKYMTEEGLNAEDGDSLWCVIDVDKWPIDMIKELGSFCINTPGCHIAISNPCFKSHNVKVALSKLTPGGFSATEYVKLMAQAIINAKAKDSQPGEQHYFPALKETKVYELGEALMERIGKNSWQDFINKNI